MKASARELWNIVKSTTDVRLKAMERKGRFPDKSKLRLLRNVYFKMYMILRNL